MKPDKSLIKALDYLKNYPRRVKIMEVCGTHTVSIAKSGLRSLLSPNISLVSGPGCPVCVTPAAYIDALSRESFAPDTCVLSFGDLFKTPGREWSFQRAKAEGGGFKIIYSPFEAISLAKANPNTTFILAAVGFETTAPLYAAVLEELAYKGISNVRLAAALKTMPPALAYICEGSGADGFLCPGHVSSIIGANAFSPLCERYKKPFVIAGFTAEMIIPALCRILMQLDKGCPSVENLYQSAVRDDGNNTALELIYEYFKPADGYWRGIGQIKGSALQIKEKYNQFGFSTPDGPEEEPTLCACADIMLGRLNPNECVLFGKECTPQTPAGACMVSAEGACGAWYGSFS